MSNVVILVPIYQPELPPIELYSLRQSLAVLNNREVRFIGPAGLDMAFYQQHFPNVALDSFNPENFVSIVGYNRLLLSTAFYQHYAQYEFMLILQTDAILLRDELDFWCAQPFDYVGAPWPDGYELFVNLGRFEGAYGKRVKVPVGNGGLSLRRVAKSIALLNEFETALRVFLHTGSSEDLFFSVFASLSADFVVPNEITASRFSMELKPSYYFVVNGGLLPMGGHAWWKYEPDFWCRLLPDFNRSLLIV